MIKYYKQQTYKDKINRVCVYILLVIFFATTLFMSERGHRCNWVDCKHTGDVAYIPKWDIPKNIKLAKYSTLTEELHYYNPTWTYKQCESVAINHYKNINHVSSR